MRITIIAVGEKQPRWVCEAYQEYAKRLPKPYSPELIEIPAATRTKRNNLARVLDEEGTKVLHALPKGTHAIALDENGAAWSSKTLAQQLSAWSNLGKPVSLLIGGPDGHAPAVKLIAQQQWSLSSLTLPHGLVRVVLIEQLYRAWTLLQAHPYHRD
jgi:23S rRNA (pseudouridine1915-N3)-methyltransferase